MIDLHCHVLPGIDDGPPTTEGALAIARSSLAVGIGAVVATPHVSWHYPNTAATIGAAVRELRDRLSSERLELSVHAGAELAATRALDIEPEELADLRLGSGPWLLLEPPFAPVATGFDEIAYSLMRQGFRIVIAHPERCPAFHRDATMLNELVDVGALTSITAGSLTGRFGRHVQRFAAKLVDEQLAHNVASDAHDSTHRPPSIAAELESAGISGGLREWLTELVPAAILAGEPIPQRPPSHLAKRRGLLARLKNA